MDPTAAPLLPLPSPARISLPGLGATFTIVVPRPPEGGPGSRTAEEGADTWWVLDYKLQHRPEELGAYHEQLAAYRAAVAQAQPGARVRSAFIAGDGRLVESA